MKSTFAERWTPLIATAVLSVASIVAVSVRLLCLGGGRQFCAEFIGKRTAQLLMRIAGLEMRVHDRDKYALPSDRSVVYISNHSSTLDIFILMALGLPRARFFMKRRYALIPPIGLLGWAVGTFWTVPQDQPERRTKIFQRAERVLRRTGDSVFLSPEGTRVTDGSIGPFNKGAFHLAMSLGAQILPIFIRIPPDVDPGKGLRTGAGSVDIWFGAPIETTDWQLDQLVQHKDEVREMYVKWSERLGENG